MTTHIASPMTSEDPQVTDAHAANAIDRPVGIRAVKIVAGVALASGPVLWAAGMFTSPASSSNDTFPTSIHVAGMLLSDWWNLSLAQNLPIDQAAKVFAGFKNSSVLGLWDGAEMFSLVGTVVLLVGLARAGILALWNLAVFRGRVRRPDVHPVGPAQVVCARRADRLSPFAVIGARLVRRARLEC